MKAVGAKTGSSVSKNTFAVLVKDINETSGKVADAKKHGVTVMVREEFVEKYLVGGTYGSPYINCHLYKPVMAINDNL